jgi:hypothetical protein
MLTWRTNLVLGGLGAEVLSKAGAGEAQVHVAEGHPGVGIGRQPNRSRWWPSGSATIRRVVTSASVVTTQAGNPGPGAGIGGDSVQVDRSDITQ